MLASLGVTFGISVFIAMVSFMTGTNDFMNDLLLKNVSHIRMFNEISMEEESVSDRACDTCFNVVHHQRPQDREIKIKNAKQILQLLDQNDDIAAVSPNVISNSFLKVGPIRIMGNIVGVDIIKENEVMDLRSKMVSGELENLLANKNGMIIGHGMAKKLNIAKDDRVRAISPDGVELSLKVVGIFRTGLTMLDESQCYVNLDMAQKLVKKRSDFINQVKINVVDLGEAAHVASQLGQQFGYPTEDWLSANADAMAGEALRNIITYAVAISLLIVAGFGIYNILTMMIYEKMNDIAILKATGFSAADIRAIFISEALIIGIVGGAVGLTLGYFMAYGISKVPFETETFVAMDSLPVNFKASYYYIGAIFALATTLVSGIIPARKAAKLDPVQIIRGK